MITKNTGSIWYAGDLHIGVDHLKKIILEAESSDTIPDAIIQVGDFGFMWPKYTENMDAYLRERARIKSKVPIITCGGNHDNWNLLLELESKSESDLIEIIPGSEFYYARRGSVINIAGIKHGFLGGAISTNKHMLITNVTMWDQEEPSYLDLNRFYDNLLLEKPEVIVTHEAPLSIHIDRIGRNSNSLVRSLDKMFYQLMSEEYQPERWYFGHHHLLKKWKISGTKFYCCGKHGDYWMR